MWWMLTRFSDFFREDRPNVAKEREVSDGKGIKLFSDMQDALTSIKCRT